MRKLPNDLDRQMRRMLGYPNTQQEKEPGGRSPVHCGKYEPRHRQASRPTEADYTETSCVKWESRNAIIMTMHMRGNFYVLKIQLTRSANLANTEDIKFWHRCFGYLREGSIRAALPQDLTSETTSSINGIRA